MDSEKILNETPLVGIARLYSWATNYEYKSNPFAGFLDTIGFSEDELGQKLVPEIKYDLMSLDLLADALKDYLSSPNTATDLINQLIESEQN